MGVIQFELMEFILFANRGSIGHFIIQNIGNNLGLIVENHIIFMIRFPKIIKNEKKILSN